MADLRHQIIVIIRRQQHRQHPQLLRNFCHHRHRGRIRAVGRRQQKRPARQQYGIGHARAAAFGAGHGMPADVANAPGQPLIQRAHDLSFRAGYIGQNAPWLHHRGRLHRRADHVVRRHGHDDQVGGAERVQVRAPGVQCADLARRRNRLRVDVDAHDLPGHRPLPEGQTNSRADETHTNDADSAETIHYKTPTADCQLTIVNCKLGRACQFKIVNLRSAIIALVGAPASFVRVLSPAGPAPTSRSENVPGSTAVGHRCAPFRGRDGPR